MTDKQRVLVIDDEKLNLKILRDILCDEVDVILAKNGRQGIEKAVEYTPDLILLDVVMPGMDGFETMTALRHDARTSAIPVIFVTALDDAGHEEKGLLLGAGDYIQKPFHVGIVQARVRLHLQLAQQRSMLERLANIDPLTTIANRRKYQEVLDVEWRAAIRDGSGLSLAVVDIDNFKQYNDNHGHAAGDRVLQQVAGVLSAQFKRPRDLVARYGGEEFVVLMPDSDREGAIDMLTRCGRAVENLQLFRPGTDCSDVVTVSIGGATCRPNPSATDGYDADKLFRIADEMLYLAKREGKNRVLWFDSEGGGPLLVP